MDDVAKWGQVAARLRMMWLSGDKPARLWMMWLNGDKSRLGYGWGCVEISRQGWGCCGQKKFRLIKKKYHFGPSKKGFLVFAENSPKHFCLGVSALI